jgi:lysophospholipase L1-like esterase
LKRQEDGNFDFMLKSQSFWKSLVLRLSLFVFLFTFPFLALQIFVKPLPRTHSVFPYITLEDDTLPFYNWSGFHDTVYSVYALDEYIAGRLAAYPNDPLFSGAYNFKSFLKLMFTPGHSLKTTPIKPEIQEIAKAAGGDPLLYRVDINEWGFREPAFSREKAPDTLRIVLAGDSLSFGYGVAREDTWAYQLEKELQKTLGPKKKIEVLNAGVISFDSHLGGELIRQKVLPLNPDWIILGYGFNDYSFNSRDFVKGGNYSEPGYFEKKRAYRESAKGKFVSLVRRLRLVQLARAAVEKGVRKIKGNQEDPRFPELQKKLDLIKGKHSFTDQEYKRNMTQNIDLIQSQGVRVFLLNSNITSPHYLKVLEELKQQYQVPFVDFRNLFAQEIGVSMDEPEGEAQVLFQVQFWGGWLNKEQDVYIRGDFFSAVEFGLTPLNDRGINGDKIAGDHIYSTTMPFQWGTILSFRFGVYEETGKEIGEDWWLEEFQGWRIYRRLDVSRRNLPPNANASDVLEAPLYIFNDLSKRTDRDFAFKPLMAETCHPNRKGNQVIAQGIASVLQTEL